jgi:hypothetical protein
MGNIEKDFESAGETYDKAQQCFLELELFLRQVLKRIRSNHAEYNSITVPTPSQGWARVEELIDKNRY